MFQKALWYALIVLLEIVLIAVFIGSDTVLKEIRQEQAMTQVTIGTTLEAEIVEKTQERFDMLFKDTGIVEWSFKLVIPTTQEADNSLGLENMGKPAFQWAHERLRTFWHAVYQSVYRFSLLGIWLPFCLPLIIPAIIDGLSKREVKKYTFGYASPVRYHSAMHMLVAGLMLVPGYMFFPLAINPIMVPIWATAMALILSMLSSNIQKRI